MDRRLEERSPCNLPAKLTSSKSGHTGPARIGNLSESGICIISSLRLEQGEQVQIDLADNKIFGHISYCHPEGSLFRSGIEVVQVLVGGAQLSRLLESLLAGSEHVSAEDAAVVHSGSAKPGSEKSRHVPSEIHLG
jgi:PilZ domain-containing protein